MCSRTRSLVEGIADAAHEDAVNSLPPASRAVLDVGVMTVVARIAIHRAASSESCIHETELPLRTVISARVMTPLANLDGKTACSKSWSPTWRRKWSTMRSRTWHEHAMVDGMVDEMLDDVAEELDEVVEPATC